MTKARQAIAKKIRNAYTTHPIPPIRDEAEETSIDAAYAIQDDNTSYWIAEGRTLVGRKIGLTSEAVQAQLGVDQPDFGMLFADRSFSDNSDVERGLFIQPRVEAEMAFVLNRDLTDRSLRMRDLTSAIDFVVASIEIVDSRIANWDISLFDTIADNASFGGFVLGSHRHKISDLDMINAKMIMYEDGEPISNGIASACMGNPLNAALWLANEMVERSRPLRAGDVILSGALGPMTDALPGNTYRAEIEGLGSVCMKMVD